MPYIRPENPWPTINHPQGSWTNLPIKDIDGHQIADEEYDDDNVDIPEETGAEDNITPKGDPLNFLYYYFFL